MLVERCGLPREVLKGQVAIVTGAGRGIGFEAARALAWLGATVVIAEIDERTGARAAEAIDRELGPGRAVFVPTDVGDAGSVARLADEVLSKLGRADIVLNNATLFRMGAVTAVPIEDWDRVYAVNLRGPVLLAQRFLPAMVERDHGVFVCVSSSGAAPYMGAYEVFKTSQVELAKTIDAEMEGRNVFAFTIGPGLVRTPGSEEGIAAVAPLYGKTTEEFYELSREAILSVEEAGTGFAAAVALASRYRGQEISSVAVLTALGVRTGEPAEDVSLPEGRRAEALALARQAHQDLAGQSRGWKEMALFKRQWILRDFKQNAGMPLEEWLLALASLEGALERGEAAGKVPLEQLDRYYERMQRMSRDYEKDKVKAEENHQEIQKWRDVLRQLIALLG